MMRAFVVTLTFVVTQATQDPTCVCNCNVVVNGCVSNVQTSKDDAITTLTPSLDPQEDFPRDCTEIRNNDDLAVSGDYMINPDEEGEAFRVYCDMDTDGGGWTVIQRREDGSVDFYRNWNQYKLGFGNVNSEHWLGNDKIHRISSAGNYELRIDMSSFESETRYAQYENFSIGDEGESYKLTVGAYSGDAGDSFHDTGSTGHNNQKFSTYDRDNDDYIDSCATRFQGAWWYRGCHSSNLNGLYFLGANNQYAKGITWSYWKDYYYSLEKTEMKIRRI